MERPTRVLCKRTFINGTMKNCIKGKWYEVIHNENDSWNERDKTFTVRNEDKRPELHYMYTKADQRKWPSICLEEGYGPRDYAKWFYTPSELKRIQKHGEAWYETYQECLKLERKAFHWGSGRWWLKPLDHTQERKFRKDVRQHRASHFQGRLRNQDLPTLEAYHQSLTHLTRGQRMIEELGIK